MALTAKRRAFVAEYLVDKNATQAAIRAGYSPRTAKYIASELMQTPEVKVAVKAALDAQVARVEVDADEILRALKQLAFFDLAEAYDEEGRLKKLRDMPEDVRRSIAGLESEELFAGSGEGRTQIGLSKKVKLISRLGALELLGKHKKLFTDKVELAGSVTLAVVDPYAEKKP